MNDPGQTVARRNGIWEHIASYDGSADFDELPSATDASAGLISLGFIGSALRRGMLIWLATAAIGFFAGVGLALQHQSAHAATTTVLLDNPGDTQGAELQTDEALAQSIPVATAVIAQLRLQQTPMSFLNTYTAGSSAPQIMTITAHAPTDDAAVQRVSAVATQFLAFRAKYLQVQQQLTIDSLNQQISKAQQNLSSINQQISKVSAGARSPDQDAELAALSKQQTDATSELNSVRANASSAQLQAQTSTSQMVHGSEVLSSATPVARPGKKTLVEYVAGGLLGGLFIGMALVMVAAITTDRLRRRDDIAIAVGAPVRLSVGRMRGRRWLPDLREKSGRRKRDMERVVRHLGDALPVNSKGPASLAVVAVDDAPTVAQAVVRLAIVCSQQRKRVVLADLSAGTTVARRLRSHCPRHQHGESGWGPHRGSRSRIGERRTCRSAE